MIAWSRRRTLIAGVSLILAVNAIVLAGVAYNRSGAPESTVQLSERELQAPYGRWKNKENSGVALNLRWRVHSGTDAPDTYYEYASYGGTAAWLDKAKLAALGMDVSQEQSRTTRRFKQPRMKEVLLVLELDGPAYRQSLERARKKADDEEKLNEANPGNKEFAQRTKAAKERLVREELENSRLFVIDAGFDVEALRVQYPDQAHYLIVRGQIRPQHVTRNRQEYLMGSISAISISQINVPVEFQPVLMQTGPTNKPACFKATVAYGKRSEPWIVALSEHQGDSK